MGVDVTPFACGRKRRGRRCFETTPRREDGKGECMTGNPKGGGVHRTCAYRGAQHAWRGLTQAHCGDQKRHEMRGTPATAGRSGRHAYLHIKHLRVKGCLEMFEVEGWYDQVRGKSSGNVLGRMTEVERSQHGLMDSSGTDAVTSRNEGVGAGAGGVRRAR